MISGVRVSVGEGRGVRVGVRVGVEVGVGVAVEVGARRAVIARGAHCTKIPVPIDVARIRTPLKTTMLVLFLPFLC